jgi:hypothetical protein
MTASLSLVSVVLFAAAPMAPNIAVAAGGGGVPSSVPEQTTQPNALKEGLHKET